MPHCHHRHIFLDYTLLFSSNCALLQQFSLYADGREWPRARGGHGGPRSWRKEGESLCWTTTTAAQWKCKMAVIRRRRHGHGEAIRSNGGRGGGGGAG
uniref:Uncharacterized protein n=1 Tax=Oryza punctata TaxID=4537 RepID=A0A0E0LYF4_ORYPU